MKLVLSAATAASLALSALLPTAAQAEDPIVVSGAQTSIQAYATRLANGLSEGMDRSLRAQGLRSSTAYGLATITFTVAEQGQVGDVDVVRNTGDWMLQRVARQAVRNLDIASDTIPIRGTHRVRAYMIVAPTEQAGAEMARKVDAIERERRLAFGKAASSNELVLTFSRQTTG